MNKQTQKFLDGFRDYDAIGKIIEMNKHKQVFREAFRENIEKAENN